MINVNCFQCTEQFAYFQLVTQKFLIIAAEVEWVNMEVDPLRDPDSMKFDNPALF
jgi:hypothetical protein